MTIPKYEPVQVRNTQTDKNIGGQKQKQQQKQQQKQKKNIDQPTSSTDGGGNATDGQAASTSTELTAKGFVRIESATQRKKKQKLATAQ